MSNYVFSQCIPCLARCEVLQHLNVDIDEETTGVAELTVQNGRVYHIPVRNEANRSWFEGPSWRAMAEAEGLQGGQGQRLWMSFGATPTKFLHVLYNGYIQEP